jgi:hypothetical protein
MLPIVMRGLDPRIHDFPVPAKKKAVDGRDKHGHDGGGCGSENPRHALRHLTAEADGNA